MSFREWPASRVLWLSAAWIVLTLGFLVWRLARAVQAHQDDGVGAVSFGIAELLAPVLGPPILFVLLWCLRRIGKTGDVMKRVEKKLKEADKLVKKRHYDEGRVIYEQLAAFFRDVREAQRQEMPGQTIPLSLRLMVANRDLSVPLDRLGELHLRLGNAREAAGYFREEAKAMEEAVSNAGGETKTELEALLATARGKLAKGVDEPAVQVDPAQYAARYQRVFGRITNMSRLPGEATLLLARRILQVPLASVSDADVRRAIVEINQLPNFAAPLGEQEIDRLVEAQGATIRALATELADIYRDHPRLT